ncbi:MAG: hypothetical protein LIO59_00205 [Oscillospiraceae bacterium]|nr:hypothetical protein [Oscillospiraceae bacterium]
MEDLIMKIIDIESRAQEIIKDAKEADKNLDANIEEETKKLHADIERRAQIKGETIRSIEDEDAEKRIEQIRKNTEESIALLEKKYNEKKENWIDTIVGSIIGG